MTSSCELLNWSCVHIYNNIAYADDKMHFLPLPLKIFLGVGEGRGYGSPASAMGLASN